MSQIVDFYKKYISRLNKYWVVTILFFAFTFLIGDSNIFNRYKYDERIDALEKEIEYYKKEIETNTKKLEDLQENKVGLEQFAREEYRMKKPNEDIFIIEE